MKELLDFAREAPVLAVALAIINWWMVSGIVESICEVFRARRTNEREEPKS